MKKILVPTDFSPIADNAARYAIEVAAEFKSELYLCHVYSFDRFNYDLNFPEDEQPFAREAERRINRTKLRFQEKIAQNGLSVTAIARQGNIFSLFKREVKKHGIDLIIMGSKGATGLKKVIFGSVAATALELAQVPVLVVPPGYSFHPLQHIVIAMGHNEVSPTVFSPLQKLAAKFGAKATLLRVNTGSDRNIYRKIDLYLEGVETTYREAPMSKSINETINEFFKGEGCDLLCMIRRKKVFFESAFKKSIIRAQVFSNQVPLLVLPEV